MSKLEVVLKTLEQKSFAPDTKEVAGFLAILANGTKLMMETNVQSFNLDGSPVLDEFGAQVVLPAVAVFSDVPAGSGTVAVYAVDVDGTFIGAGVTTSYTVPEFVEPDVLRSVPSIVTVTVG